MVSAGHVCGTHGSGIVYREVDMLWMSVVRGVGGVCEMCMCLAWGSVGEEGGEWMRGLGLGFTNPVGTGEVLDVCLYFGCGGVGGQWVGGWTRVWRGGVVCVSCESGFSV